MNKKKQTVKSDSLFLFAKNLRNLNTFVEKVREIILVRMKQLFYNFSMDVEELCIMP